MVDLIPHEILVDILLRLKVKDLVNCKCVSKKWLSIIDDPHFIRSQLGRSLSTYSNSILFIQQHGAFPTPLVLLYWKVEQSDTSSSFFSTVRSTQKLRLRGSCHGLLWFSRTDYDPRSDFVILNPSTGERHTLANPSKQAGITYGTLMAYGLGYDNLSDDYKILRIFRTTHVNPSHIIAEIYGVRSNCFYSIPLAYADWNNNCSSSLIGVFYGRSLHWCNWNCNVSQHVIDAIDIVSNTYRKLHLPETTFGNRYRIQFVTVGVVDGCLCLSAFHMDGREIGIWVMEEYGNSESWNRIYCILRDDVKLPVCPFNVTYLRRNGDKILLMIDWCILVSYDRAKKNVDEAKFLTSTDCWFASRETIYCLESLVKIFPNVVKKEALTISTLRNWLARKLRGIRRLSLICAISNSLL
ncbi:F-box protein CPR1 [Linum grandiflorum]